MKRPGISEAVLAANGVREIAPDEAKKLIGQSVAGILIPYHNLDGSESGFHRLRLKSPSGDMKYSQAQGSGVHIYIPVGIERGIETLGIVEGEFKAIALTEAGFPTLGISGFYGWQEGGSVHPELAEALAYFQPQKIEWIGDSDTLLNPDFYTATARMVGKLPSFQLVRMPWNGPKGADDMREELGGRFASEWFNLPRIEPDSDEVTMLDRLLTAQHEQLDVTSPEVFGKLCKCLGRFASSPSAAMLQDKVRSLLKIKAGILRDGISSAKRAVERGDVVSEEAELVVRRSYTDGAKWYVDLNGSGRFTKLTLESWRNQLVFFGATAAQISNSQATVEQNRMVSYAGPLCGRPIGYREEGPLQVLVTEGYTLRKGTARTGTVPEQFFTNLLGAEQMEYFIPWLKQARKSLADPTKNVPGQAVFFVGGTGLGKTLGQKIITACIGGREADPQAWIKGLTTFNSDLWRAEHLTISDATILDDWKARHRLTGSIKEIVANVSVPLHAKYGEPVTLKPIWRFTGSVNTTPSSIRTLPSVDDDNKDKLMLFWCGTPGWDFEPGLEVWDLIEPDLDDFCAWVDEFETDPDLVDCRYGVKGYVHPKVNRLVHGESLEGQLEGILDLYFIGNTEPLEGSAAYIYETLKQYASINWIRSPMALGRMLGKLATMDDGTYRVSQERSKTCRNWSIEPSEWGGKDPF